MPQAHAATTVTLLVSIINDLTNNANLANEMLAKERKLVLELFNENIELKLRTKSFEAATRPNPRQTQTISSKPPLSTVLEESYRKNDRMPPLGEIDKEKQENTKETNKILKLKILNVNNDQVTTKDYARTNKNWKRRNTNIKETKETERRTVLIMGDSELRKFNGMNCPEI